MLKLNLCSGSDYRPGWQNLDIEADGMPGYPPPDVIWDARKHTIPFPDESADEVVAGYMLAHIGHCLHHEPLLREVHRVLCPGGTLLIDDIDMELVMPRWLADPDNVALSELIWGEQGHHEGRPELEAIEATDHHCAGYTEASLRRLLERVGFVDIERVWIHDREANWYSLCLRSSKPDA